jgi:hypothetical protein
VGFKVETNDHAQAVSPVRDIMSAFSSHTGLAGASRPPQRYLWTDAFAVCNFLELYRQTGEKNYLEIVHKLIDQVHFVLGRYSEVDPRRGWISGLEEEVGYEHPTSGGLRIGKKLAERKPDEPFDERLEWERDGQYFHYLTKWIHALNRVTGVTGDGRFHRWALELASASHAGFTYTAATGQPKRMWWKMSIDLSRPLVASMGHHDPLDALITYMQLRATPGQDGSLPGDINLEEEIADCRAMCAGKSWVTDDPLGTGNLLADAFRLAQIMSRLNVAGPVTVESLLADCEAGLNAFVSSGLVDQCAEYRLAFRELGLSIGLHSIVRLQRLIERSPDRFSSDRELPKLLARLNKFVYLSDVIERFWLDAEHQQNPTWCDHRDINTVMLATSLAPDGYLLV